MSLVSINDFIEIIKTERQNEIFQQKVNNQQQSKATYQGLCFNFTVFDILVFGEGGCLSIFKKPTESNEWSLITDLSNCWDIGEVNSLFDCRMEVIDQISIVDVEIYNKQINTLTFKNELATFDTLCDKISNSRNNGKFGWNDDHQLIKGTIFEFEGLKILAYAAASYISIASQKDGSEEWEFHSSHPTCWRQDGVRRLMRQSRKVLAEKPVLVTPTMERMVGQVTYQ
jgi:hypothetical protein